MASTFNQFARELYFSGRTRENFDPEPLQSFHGFESRQARHRLQFAKQPPVVFVPSYNGIIEMQYYTYFELLVLVEGKAA